MILTKWPLIIKNTYSDSICALNCSIYSNSFSCTKWTNLMRFSKSSLGCAFSAPAYSGSASVLVRTALSMCKATVQSFPPLKLKAISSGLKHIFITQLSHPDFTYLNMTRASLNVYIEASISC